MSRRDCRRSNSAQVLGKVKLSDSAQIDAHRGTSPQIFAALSGGRHVGLADQMAWRCATIVYEYHQKATEPTDPTACRDHFYYGVKPTEEQEADVAKEEALK